MARIVIASWGSYGDVYPYVGLALELRRRGHQALLAMPAFYRAIVEQEGLQFHPTRPDIDVRDRALAARIMSAARGPEAIFGEVLIPHLAETHADLMQAAEGADAVVSHPASPVAPMVAQERRLCWISSVLAPLSFFSAHDPITPPPAPWLQPLLAKSRPLSRAFLWLTDRITRQWGEPIQRFRVSRGLARGDNPILGGQHSPNLVLAMFSKVLASPQPDWPVNTYVTGASMYNGEAATSLAPELAAFVDAGPPPIVFTLGTSAVASAGQFYETSTKAVERLGVRAVMLIGPFAENRPARVGPNVHLADFAPHAALFPRASVVVHQGGAGTTHQALASGRPTLVVPHSHDQPDNARRVTALGVARTLIPGRYKAAAVERELRELTTPPYAQRATSIAEVVRAENGPRAAAEAIESALSTARTRIHHIQ